MDPRGVDVGAVLPELAGLAVRVAARSAVLDGELVVVDARGRADDEALRRAAVRASPGGRWRCSCSTCSTSTACGCSGQPLEKRRAALRRVLRPGDEVVVVPAITGEGRALHAAVSAQGIAGVLARRRTSPYLPGVRSRLWRSIVARGAGRGAGGAARPRRRGEPDGGGTGPVLALFRRLPFDEDPGLEG